MFTILQGNALDMLRTVPDESVRCCITSPPYFGLRAYLPPEHPDKSLEIGTEKRLEDYIDNLVQVFREVRRVLTPDGTLWLNIGDAYNGSGGAGGDYNKGGKREGQLKYPGRRLASLKPKDLIGVPWEVAFALRTDGWYLRNDCIWYKKGAFPENCPDRFTREHEYVFMFSKNARYYYDKDTIREPLSPATIKRASYGRKPITPRAWRKENANGVCEGKVTVLRDNPKGRAKGTVWTIPGRKRYKAVHFATFPEELVEIPLKAGSAPGDIVLDPFMGSGTVGAVALRYGRKFIGIDLVADYCRMAEERLQQVLQQ